MKKRSERQVRAMLAGAGLACFVLLMSLEMITEEGDIQVFDLLVDALSTLLTIGGAVGAAMLAQRMHVQHEEKITLIRDLDMARAEGEAWREKVQSHLAGLKGAMDKQFLDWGMTGAEREVGLLILKGLTHQEVAALRATTEATVRQQAQSIYRKADLPGKTAFSAYFLEDLFSPEFAPQEPTRDQPVRDQPMPHELAPRRR